MSERFEYYNAGTPAALWSMRAEFWGGQSFTPQVSHIITSYKVQAYRANSPGTLTLEFWLANQSTHVPSGSPLATGTINANTFATTLPGALYEITLSTGVSLSKDVIYCVTMDCRDGDNANKVYLVGEVASPAYARGRMLSSNDSGVTWGNYIDRDLEFEEWGDAVVPGGSGGSAALLVAQGMI